MTQLHRIQNSLDQRGNIVIAFILNGLYLKDFHTLLRLDHWRKKYGPDIETWTDVLSEADALISMANYRFNHPAYCLPVICQDRLLDTEEIGHPLLKANETSPMISVSAPYTKSPLSPEPIWPVKVPFAYDRGKSDFSSIRECRLQPLFCFSAHDAFHQYADYR